MKSNRIIIIGFNEIGQSLLGRLSRDFDITVVSRRAETARALKELKREDVTLITGDPTSRLVLEDAQIDTADAVIVTSKDDRVNLEVVDVMTNNFNPRKLISVGHTLEGTSKLEELGIEVINVFSASATAIRNKIEMRAKAALEIGIGKNEILEVEVHPHSKLANKPLGHLDPIRWRVGLVYREGNIIIPRKDTVIKPRDRMVILGDPQVLRTVADIFTFDFDRFPLEYGSIGIVYLSGREEKNSIDEMNYLFSSFPLDKTVVILSERARSKRFAQTLDLLEIPGVVMKATSLPMLSAIEDTLFEVEGKQGLIGISSRSLAASPIPLLASYRNRKTITSLMSAARCPILIARNTFPYEHMCFPCIKDVDVEHVIETAFEISMAINNSISALHVKPSTYIASDDEEDEYEAAKRMVSEMSLVYKSKVEPVELSGNPIHAVTDELSTEGYNLLLLSSPVAGRGGIAETYSRLFNPDVLWNVLMRSPLSTMITPQIEEAL